jgi:formamidopyrimidine-DNA glycosylase
MPELPDIEVYLDALRARALRTRLEAVRLKSPFLLRSTQPPLSECAGRNVAAFSRLGKRIVIQLEEDLFLVLHLMIAGRLHWKPPGAALTARQHLAAFDFDSGTLTLTEAGSERRASLHCVRGEAALRALDPGGIDPLSATPAEFAAALSRENHTLKRALTDPRLFSGIGNAYSDEILHAARLSPVSLTSRLAPDQIEQLRLAAVATLDTWIVRLREEAADRFPEKVTAFRAGMAVHGRFREPCPVCATAVQRIRYASNETNYCPRCQTGGRLLADRSLSRLLREDWPKSIGELA